MTVGPFEIKKNNENGCVGCINACNSVQKL